MWETAVMGGPATIVEISGRRFDVPLDCPCCGATPDTEISVGLARNNRDRAADSATSVDFPYCRFCVAHVTRWESGGVVMSGLIVIAILVLIAAAIASELALGVGVCLAIVMLALVAGISRRNEARRACRPSCGAVGRSVAYLGWSGTASGFAFQSIAYGAKFAEQNAARLVDDPRIKKLLQHYKLARIAVPTPAAAVTVIPPPLGVGEWVARLAATSTRVARRSALAIALESLPEPREREQVVRSVCAIELASVLAPLDRLASTTAKRRHLRAAIHHIRRDNVPEPLQQALLHELEQRLS
jgi:hypothetical protein